MPKAVFIVDHSYSKDSTVKKLEVENKYLRRRVKILQARLDKVRRESNKRLMSAPARKRIVQEELKDKITEPALKILLSRTVCSFHSVFFPNICFIPKHLVFNELLEFLHFDLFQGQTKSKSWTKKDYSNALRLKCYSSAALEFVRKNILPLPHARTLNRKFHFLHVAPGKIRPAFEYLKDLGNYESIMFDFKNYW